MPCVKRSLLALAAVALLTFFPKVTFAATSAACECFCGVAVAGATSQGQMKSDACQDKCVALAEDTPGTQFVGCFADPKFYPDRNSKCWTKDECSGEGSWRGPGQMPYECMKHKTSGDEMSYCYAPDAPYTLNVPIGSVTTISNLPTYINTIYTWLLPAASLIAVVMMMLGGLQYVLSRGKSKYIDKAKTRITNAITGLVLLLAVFVILNLIDPRLTIFNSLQVPMLKEVVLLDASASCERLDDYGYAITQVVAPASCGGTGQITGYDADFPDNVLGSWEIDDKCEYMGCDGGLSCVADGDTKTCVSCSDTPSPSESICSAISNTGKGLPEQTYCSYTENVDGLQTGPTCTSASVAMSSSSEGFNCRQLQQTAYALEGTSRKGCGVYADLYLRYSSEQAGFESIRLPGIGIGINGINGASLLEKICNDDFCGIAEYVGGGSAWCQYFENSKESGIIDTAINYWLGTSTGEADYVCATMQ